MTSKSHWSAPKGGFAAYGPPHPVLPEVAGRVQQLEDQNAALRAALKELL